MKTAALDKLPVETRDALSDIAVSINELFLSAGWFFTLKAPEKLTIVRGGSYSKRPFIGEERFKGQRAYVGKLGKVILVFSDESDSTFQVEMSLQDAAMKLDCFPAFSLELQAYRENKTMTEARKTAEKIEHLAHTEAANARNSINPIFGSW